MLNKDFLVEIRGLVGVEKYDAGIRFSLSSTVQNFRVPTVLFYNLYRKICSVVKTENFSL